MLEAGKNRLKYNKIMKRLDLTGQKFGHWTAIEWAGHYTHGKGGYSLWKCQCECGNITNVSLSALRKGISSSCGCKKKENTRKRYLDSDYQPGDVVGTSTILERVEDSYSKSGRVNKRFKLKCDCGNEFISFKHTLTRNPFTSCPNCAQLKAAKKQNTTSIKIHWKTGQEIVCVGSYEAKVIDWLNAQKKEFQWKPKTFLLPSGKRYTPDLFINELNAYIEIKGYWWNSKSYFDEFIAANLGNIQLWNKSKLQSMKLIS